MPIPNYQNPGVFVTSNSNYSLPYPTTNTLNIAFYGYTTTPPTATQTDRFVTVVTGTVAGQQFTLSQSGIVSTSSGTLVVTNGSTGSTLVSGTDYSYNTGSHTITISGTQANNVWIQAVYQYATAASGSMYYFNNFNAVQNVFGPAISVSGSSTIISSPCTLAAFLAFQNGASQVACCNIAAVSGGSPTDFIHAITSGNSSLQNNPGINVVVPLCYDTTYDSTGAFGGPLFNGLANYMGAQASNFSNYYRAFIGMDHTVPSGAQTLISTAAAIAQDTSQNSRTTLIAPQTILFDPGVNSLTGFATGTMQLDGFYVAAATAGVFVGQVDVNVPITNKQVLGFSSIPNQISTTDSNTLQAYGVTVLRQHSDGTMKIRHGLTTNTTNWLTQEISINAIGDRLVQNLTTSILAGNLIGAPLTTVTFASLQSIVLGVLTQAQSSGLIQGFQGISYQQDQIVPTQIDVTFQYAPTIPLNYINVVFSLDSQTGTVQLTSATV